MDQSKWFIKCPIFCQQNIRFKTSMLRSDFWDYRDAYIVVKRRITLERDNDAKKSLSSKIMLHLDNVYQKLTLNW